MAITKSTKHNLLISSGFFLFLALLAYFSPDHVCPYLAHIPWLAQTCPYTDATPFVSNSRKWGSRATPSTLKIIPTVKLELLPIMTLGDLKLHDGEHEGYPLRLAIDNIVLDVDTAEGRRFYAPGQSYHVFAGGDFTRALALGSLDSVEIERSGYMHY